MSTDSDNAVATIGGVEGTDAQATDAIDPVVNRDAPRHIPVAKPWITDAEINAARDAVASGWISQGPKVAEFERLIAEAHGKKFGVAVNSGTSALHLALATMNVGPGDEVILPTMTMVAVANAVLYCGATLALVDSESVTGNMDVAKADHVYGPGTKAIICPHLYGVPVQRIHKLPAARVIEDCAEAHYATYPDGSSVGSYGRMAVFSFFANKIICCGEAGMVLTDDEREAERLRSLRAHAFTPGCHFRHQELAYGYRLCDTSAAIGIVQHNRSVKIRDIRRMLVRSYRDRLCHVPWLTWPRQPHGSAHWVFPIQLEPTFAPTTRDELRTRLAEHGVETRTYFKPMHQQPHIADKYLGHPFMKFPVAESLYASGLYLPLYPEMTEDDVDYICRIIDTAGG